MSARVVLLGGNGKGNEVTVTDIGQVVVSPYSYDEVVFKVLDVDAQGYTFFSPKPDQNFIITGVVAKADRDVSATVDADVVLYESSTLDDATVDKTIFQVAMVRGEQAVLLPLNIKVNAGKYLNAKTSDDDIHMTIMGYYIPTS